MKQRQPTVHSYISGRKQTNSLLKKRSFKETMGDDQSESEVENEQEDMEFNSHCGLRTISEKVLTVLLEKRRTTYKEVSDYITNSEAQRLNLLEPPVE